MARRTLARWLRQGLSAAALGLEGRLPYLWSKGFSQYCDVAGPWTYRLGETEAGRSAAFFRRHYAGARGLVWVRLGSTSRVAAPCDLDRFVEAALPTIRHPFALITTDGDASVPSDLAESTVRALFDCPWLVSWHTQNHDGHAHAKLAPIPIGLDLHTPRPWIRGQRLAARLRRLRESRPAEPASLRVFCDLGVSLASDERRRAVAALRDCDHVDFQGSRIAQAAIWQKYARYAFALSAPGNGLDCHRTWELLYLGCIVITRTSSLDPLFDGLPVVIVEDWKEVRDKASLVRWFREYGPLTECGRIWERLDPSRYMGPVRAALRESERR